MRLNEWRQAKAEEVVPFDAVFAAAFGQYFGASSRRALFMGIRGDWHKNVADKNSQASQRRPIRELSANTGII